MSGPAFSTAPVSAVALAAALDVTRAWRSLARHSLLAAIKPVYRRPVTAALLSDPDSPAGVAFTTAKYSTVTVHTLCIYLLIIPLPASAIAAPSA